MLPLRARCLYVRNYQMVANVTPRQPGLRWNARNSVQFLAATKTTECGSGAGSESGRLNRELADVSRALLRLGRWAADGRKFQNLAKLDVKAAPKLPQTLCARRFQGHILVLAQPRTLEMRNLYSGAEDWFDRCVLPNCWMALSAAHGSSCVEPTLSRNRRGSLTRHIDSHAAASTPSRRCGIAPTPSRRPRQVQVHFSR